MHFLPYKHTAYGSPLNKYRGPAKSGLHKYQLPVSVHHLLFLPATTSETSLSNLYLLPSNFFSASSFQLPASSYFHRSLFTVHRSLLPSSFQLFIVGHKCMQFSSFPIHNFVNGFGGYFLRLS